MDNIGENFVNIVNELAGADLKCQGFHTYNFIYEYRVFGSSYISFAKRNFIVQFVWDGKEAAVFISVLRGKRITPSGQLDYSQVADFSAPLDSNKLGHNLTSIQEVRISLNERLPLLKDYLKKEKI
jgi:hypothetical protein